MKPVQNSSPAPGDGPADSPLQSADIRPFVKHRKSGVALLIVLGMLVLLAVIVVAFVTSVTTDLADSKAYEAQITTKMLSDSVVDLVISEIRQASTGTAADGTALAWITQPGLTRTYDDQGNTTAFKLYSASQMVVSGSFDPNAGGDLPTGSTWLNEPNLYTDLNSPIAVTSSTLGATTMIFPIIDGNGIKSIPIGSSTTPVFTYSTSGSIPDVEGFSTNPAQVGVNYNTSSSLSGTNNPVPMPVMWLYMLKDGTLIAPSAVGNSKDVTFNGAIMPTGTNPIVARVAFWTDDESCKVNINTASEGVFWDTPVAVSQPPISDASEPDPAGNAAYISDPNQVFEWDLAQRQPDQREYQRYPGHPATTCLSPVLGAAVMRGLGLSGTGTLGVGYHTLTGTSWSTFAEYMYQLAPRVSGSDAPGTSGQDFSSKAGTYRPGGPTLTSTGTSGVMGTGTAITPDVDRLYSTVDELFYSGTIATGSTSRYYNGQAIGSGTILTPALLDQAKFFLTANSKSPEVNMFNMPRVCMWPITKTASTLDNSDTSNPNVYATMTAFDKVIAICATVTGTNPATSGSNRIPFYFSRYDPFSQTNDYSGTNNPNLYTYLHNLMNTPFPGFGPGTFTAKYPSEDTGNANQILTEIYDYIRCTNLADCTEDLPAGPYGAKSYTMVNPLYQWTNAAWNSQSSQGQVVPIVIGNTRGMGRVLTVGELALVMVKEDERMIPGVSETTSGTIIPVSSALSAYSGTWMLSATGGMPSVQNYANVLVGDPGKTIYATPYPNGHTPPAADVLLLPGAGGLPATYDPRKQTKIQLALVPYYYSSMAGFSSMGNNVRLHWSNVNITVSGTDGVAQQAVAPGFPGTTGTQGEDLYDSGRLETINQGESKVGGPMGSHSLIDPVTRGGVPSELGAPSDSMFQVLEVVINGTSAPGGSFTSTGSNTMTVTGSATLQIVVPGTTNGVTWAGRGINDQSGTIQTINFVWPPTVVQIPCLNTQGGIASPFVGLQSGSSTYSGNLNTAESMFIKTGSNVKITGTSRINTGNNNYTDTLINPGQQDIIRSLQLSGTSSVSHVQIGGDYRIPALMQVVSGSLYQPLPKYLSGTLSGSVTPYFYTGTRSNYDFQSVRGDMNYSSTPLGPKGNLIVNGSGTSVVKLQYADTYVTCPYVPTGIDGVLNSQGMPGDWENGVGWQVDGAYFNKPDEGWTRHYETNSDFVSSSIAPLIGHPYAAEDTALGLPTLYAPNKMVSSPVMFGALPTGALAQHPWQDLLFRPAKFYFPGGNGTTTSSILHPGAGIATAGGLTSGSGVLPYGPYSVPPDHLLLDLFWMPVVDPYPISEPFATAGKVNLNYQIAPFTYITRKTALRAVMQSVKITAMNPMETCVTGGVFSSNYKSPGSYGNTQGGAGVGGGIGVCIRRNIDLDDTLNQIDQLRFAVNKPFLAASEICDVPLIPGDLPPSSIAGTGTSTAYNIGTAIKAATPATYDGILQQFWYGDPTNTANNPPPAVPQFGHRLTGNNSLERPYALIYPRLTTKSNTFTVHVRVQTLRKAGTTPVNVFKDGQDQVVGEFRGSFVIERYLDPAGSGFYPGGNTSLAQVSMTTPGAQLGPYKFRVISSKQFGQ